MTCIITGCTLVTHNEYVGGDLHKVGNCYVFNAIKNSNGNARWVTDESEYSHYSKRINIFGNWLEFSGVIVVPMANAVLNVEAQEYIGS